MNFKCEHEYFQLVLGIETMRIRDPQYQNWKSANAY